MLPSGCCRVLERITKDSCSGAGNRAAAAFEEDDGIDARFRNKLTDFQMSGYDRGHMVGVARACQLKRKALLVV
jgi:DNA/RNA endonuclease G (NUC1)